MAMANFNSTTKFDGPEWKQKFFSEFEAIRKQLQELTGLPSTSETTLGSVSDNNMRDKIRNVKVRPNPTSRTGPGSLGLRIRTHLARDAKEEKPTTDRDLWEATSPDLPAHLERDRDRVRDSLEVDKTDGRTGKKFEQQPRRDTQTIRTPADPRMRTHHADNGQPGLAIRKHIAYSPNPRSEVAKRKEIGGDVKHKEGD
jgi:hypothetical protein